MPGRQCSLPTPASEPPQVPICPSWLVWARYKRAPRPWSVLQTACEPDCQRTKPSPGTGSSADRSGVPGKGRRQSLTPLDNARGGRVQSQEWGQVFGMPFPGVERAGLFGENAAVPDAEQQPRNGRPATPHGRGAHPRAAPVGYRSAPPSGPGHVPTACPGSVTPDDLRSPRPEASLCRSTRSAYPSQHGIRAGLPSRSCQRLSIKGANALEARRARGAGLGCSRTIARKLQVGSGSVRIVCARNMPAPDGRGGRTIAASLRRRRLAGSAGSDAAIPHHPCRGRRKRGQSPFAGTARRVLRTNGDCPLFRPSTSPA